MKDIMKFAKNYKLKIWGVIIFLVIEKVGGLLIPTFLASMVNKGVIQGNIDVVYSTGAKMLATAVLIIITAYINTYLATLVSAGIGKDIRNSIFKKSQSLSISDMNEIGVSSMIVRTTRDVAQIEEAIVMGLEMMLPAPVMVVSGLIMAFIKDKSMGLIISMTLIVFAITTGVVVIKSNKLFTMLQKAMDSMNRFMRENITGVRIIRAFNKGEYEREKVNSVFKNFSSIAIKLNRLFAIVSPIIIAVINTCTILILWIGGEKVAANTMEIGDIMVFMEYAILILVYMNLGIMVLMQMPRAVVSIGRINEIMNYSPEVLDRKEIDTENLKKESAGPEFEFRDVTFRYPDAENPVLHNISFKSKVGEVTAIIGGTGSGKSTIASLIPRLYDISEGSILIDNIDISDFSQNELRKRVSFVPQKAFLFSGTIMDNLTYGKSDATKEEVEEAARVAQARDFIESLELKYDSKVSQGGSNFSGGQKQRLSISRALVKDADIYVFDDSFSALDYKTDAVLRAELKVALKDSISIYIAQRISTIRDADQIIVLDEGNIVGIGTHEELLKSSEVYRQIVDSQENKEGSK